MEEKRSVHSLRSTGVTCPDPCPTSPTSTKTHSARRLSAIIIEAGQPSAEADQQPVNPPATTTNNNRIRVVNAFRHGMDSQQLQQASSNPNIQRVLQKQASLSGKRFSVAGSSQASVQVTSETSAAGTSTRITIPEQSYSHTETAV